MCTSAFQLVIARYSWVAPDSGAGSVQLRKGAPSIFQSIWPPLRVMVK
jgi:hypothetical protein